jgi:hypothetical protein
MLNIIKSFKYDGIEQKLSGIQIFPMVEFYNKLGDCYIGSIDNEVIGVGGIYPLWNNAGSAWLFLNQKARNYKFSIFKSLLEYTNMLIKKYEINTLIVECINDSLEAHNLIRHLGFVKNKEMKMSLYLKKIGE